MIEASSSLWLCREEQAKNFMIFFSLGSFVLIAGVVFAASLVSCCMGRLGGSLQDAWPELQGISKMAE